MKNTLHSTRQKTGLTQVEIARKAMISEASYQRIEYGIQRPIVNTAILIAEALGITDFTKFKELFGAATPAIKE